MHLSSFCFHFTICNCFVLIFNDCKHSLFARHIDDCELTTKVFYSVTCTRNMSFHSFHKLDYLESHHHRYSFQDVRFSQNIQQHKQGFYLMIAAHKESGALGISSYNPYMTHEYKDFLLAKMQMFQKPNKKHALIIDVNDFYEIERLYTYGHLDQFVITGIICDDVQNNHSELRYVCAYTKTKTQIKNKKIFSHFTIINMASKKRMFGIVEDENKAITDNEMETKRRKMHSSENDNIVHCLEENENALKSIEDVVKWMLLFIYDVPTVISDIILQYNTWNVWYNSNCLYANHEIGADIENVYYAADALFLRNTNGEIFGRSHTEWEEDEYVPFGHYDGACVLNEYFKKHGIKITEMWTNQFESTIFQDNSNKLYRFKPDQESDLVFSCREFNIVKPELIKGIENVEQVCIGYNHHIILDKTGTVFSKKIIGQYQYGQNGTGVSNFSDKNDKFHCIPFFHNVKIVAISVGKFHSLFVAKNGVVWSCGFNNHSQLGHSYPENTVGKYPQKISSLVENNIKIKTCASGNEHNLLLDECGDVYAFGSNYYGQCGLGEEIGLALIPTMIEMNQKFDHIQCGGGHSHIKSVSKIHFLFGDNKRCQCGLTDSFHVYTPLAINDTVEKFKSGEIIKIKQICVAHDRTVINVLEL